MAVVCRVLVLTVESSPMAADELGSERDRIELEDRFAQLRPEILETLRTHLIPLLFIQQ